MLQPAVRSYYLYALTRGRNSSSLCQHQAPTTNMPIHAVQKPELELIKDRGINEHLPKGFLPQYVQSNKQHIKTDTILCCTHFYICKGQEGKITHTITKLVTVLSANVMCTDLMSSEYKIFYRIRTGLFFPTTEMQWKEKIEQADCKSSRQSKENKKKSSLFVQPPIQFS